MNLDEILTARRTGDTTFELEVPPGWGQGRTTFGGVACGAMVRAIETVVGDPTRTARSLSAELFSALVPGKATLEVEVLRAGSALTTGVAHLRQGAESVAHAILALGAPRPDKVERRLVEPPSFPPLGAMVTPPSPPAPEFLQHFELGAVEGIPFTGGAPISSGYVRPRVACARRDAAYVAAMADVFWSPVAVAMEAPRPFATVSFTLSWVASLSPDDDRPLFFRSRTLASTAGYATDDRELWTVDGALVALNRQSVAVIK